MKERKVTVVESGIGPYGQYVVSGRHVFGADEPESLGGRDTGPDPYELLLAGLGACTAMTVRMYAARHGWPLTRVEVKVRHAQHAAAENDHTDRFERVITLSGDLDQEQRARLLQIAERCPVSQTLRRASGIDTLLSPVETPPIGRSPPDVPTGGAASSG